MRPFLLIAIACLALFIVAGVFVGNLIPFWGAPPKVATRGLQSAGWIWPMVQNVSALIGIVSFLIQVVQWRRSR
jgi:hypothetical protein